MAANQSEALKRVGENLYVNAHGGYFAWFSIRGKQIKRSLKTNDKTLARRRLGELREKGARLHGGEQRNIHFDELVKAWLESIRNDVKESTYERRIVCLNQMTPFFKGVPVRSIGIQEIEKWKVTRARQILGELAALALPVLLLVLELNMIALEFCDAVVECLPLL